MLEVQRKERFGGVIQKYSWRISPLTLPQTIIEDKNKEYVRNICIYVCLYVFNYIYIYVHIHVSHVYAFLYLPLLDKNISMGKYLSALLFLSLTHSMGCKFQFFGISRIFLDTCCHLSTAFSQKHVKQRSVTHVPPKL